MYRYITYEAALNVPRDDLNRADWHSGFLDNPKYKEKETKDNIIEYNGELYADYPLALRDIFIRDNSMRYIRGCLHDTLTDSDDIKALYKLVIQDFKNGIIYTDINTIVRTFGSLTKQDRKESFFHDSN